MWSISNIPIVEDEDHKISQEEALRKAIVEVTKAYEEGKKVAFHCSAGRNRTGSVAIGTLLSLGVSDTIDHAEKVAKKVRPEINVKAPLRESLQRLFPQS